MKIIGVELHAPRSNVLVGLTVLLLVFIVVAYLFAMLVGVSVSALTPFLPALLISTVSGGLAASCGCSIPESGVRGAIIVVGLCLALNGLYAGLLYLSKLI